MVEDERAGQDRGFLVDQALPYRRPRDGHGDLGDRAGVAYAHALSGEAMLGEAVACPVFR